MLAVYIFIPALIGLLLADFLIKRFASKKAGVIWIAEILLITVFIIVFKIFIV